jgi:hypothetical protein
MLHGALTGCGPSAATENSIFFSVSFYRTILIVFIQILSKFQIVFSIQIIPMKNLFREFKSNRNISERFKVYEFYSCFRCK